jgi:hypothetical protein
LVRGPLHAGSVTEGPLLPGSVLRDDYANKYWKVLLFPAESRKSRNSLKGSEQGGPPGAGKKIAKQPHAKDGNRLRSAKSNLHLYKVDILFLDSATVPCAGSNPQLAGADCPSLPAAERRASALFN